MEPFWVEVIAGARSDVQQLRERVRDTEEQLESWKRRLARVRAALVKLEAEHPEEAKRYAEEVSGE